MGDIASLCYLSKHSTMVCFQVNNSGLKNWFFNYEEPWGWTILLKLYSNLEI